jgi:hypothetical protein
MRDKPRIRLIKWHMTNQGIGGTSDDGREYVAARIISMPKNEIGLPGLIETDNFIFELDGSLTIATINPSR